MFDVDLNDLKYDCEHYLKIGCNNQFFNDFSIYKKCPQAKLKNYNLLLNANVDEKLELNEKDKKLMRKDPKYSMRSLVTKPSMESVDKRDESDDQLSLKYHKTQINAVRVDVESETNRICMAYWRKTNRMDSHDSVISNDYDTIQDEYELENEYNDEYGEEKNSRASTTAKNQVDDYVDMSYVVISKQANSDKFSCSIWESFAKSKKLRITDNDLSSCIRIIDEKATDPAESSSNDQDPTADMDPRKSNSQSQQQTRSSLPDLTQSVLNKDSQIKIVNNEYSIDNTPHQPQSLQPSEMDSFESSSKDAEYAARSERLMVADDDDISSRFQTNEKSTSQTPMENSIVFDYAGTCTSYKKKSSSAPHRLPTLTLLNILLFINLISTFL